MSSYITTADNVRLEDIRSNVNPGNEALLSLIESLEEQGVQLSDEARSSFKVFSKSLEHRRLRRIFQLKVTQYSAGEDSLQDMRQSNHDWKIKQDSRRKRGEPEFKIHENKDVSNEGRVSIFSYQRNKVVTVRFDSQLKEDLFKSSIVKYQFQKEEIVLLIPSFFNILSAARDLGVPRSRLGEVFGIYCSLAVPSLKGQMSPDPNCLLGNLEKVLEAVSIEGEQKKLESQLDQVVRNPGTKLDGFVHQLYTLYNSSVTLDHLVDDKEMDQDLDYLLTNPAQVSKHNRITEQVQALLHKAMRSLCSSQAQLNISMLIRERKTKFPPDVLKEVIFRCDLKATCKSCILVSQ